MTTEELKRRTQDFAIGIIDTINQLPPSIAGRAIAHQLVRSGTSVGANYRAACRARSNREFISKLQIVLEEADEAVFWLELIQQKEWLALATTQQLLIEGNQLVAIFVSSLRTVKAKL